MQIGVETSKALDQRRVFVVDPDEITRAALQFILHDEIETHEHATLEEAFAHGTGWLKPDVILLGVAILKEGGVGLLASVAERYPGIRIIVVTEKAEEATAVQAMKAGAHAVLVKPLTLESVRMKVDTVLGRRGGAPLVKLGLL
ncbi:response regulator [Paracraurococcus lichenis]|uniref:Response regulator n=1 Tax=Paracraurococcus lichenis TaxID=3064888 RepID=A0ABT9DYU1_9PROT|nr:response regulator [Paracraurococcus sp. LOR1-02]MDO9708915.1 response regulator [Paracraurococcus sp. LOR1-02]